MKIPDLNMRRTRALPAAGAAASSASVDLSAVEAGPLSASLMEVQIAVPALPALVEDKTVTVTLTDSADDSSYDTLETVGNMVITGGSGDGADAKTWRFYLPPHTRRYLKLTIAVLADGGNNTGVTATMDFLV